MGIVYRDEGSPLPDLHLEDPSPGIMGMGNSELSIRLRKSLFAHVPVALSVFHLPSVLAQRPGRFSHLMIVFCIYFP